MYFLFNSVVLYFLCGSPWSKKQATKDYQDKLRSAKDLPASRQGCIWHRHNNCKYFVVPKTSTACWINKINTNKPNDEKTIKNVKKEGGKIITVWEYHLKPARLEGTLSSLLKKLTRPLLKPKAK